MSDYKVLIVDDEQDICFLLSMLLKRKAITTKFVNTLSEAGGALEQFRPNLVFLDNNLPDGLGMNYINQIKSAHPDVKVVMITAHDSILDQKKAISIGADAFVGKPFTGDIIYNTIESLCA